MSEERPNPAAIMQLATGYWNSATLLAANEMNLFGILADAPLSAAQVSERLQTPLRSTQMLLDACVGLMLLQKTADVAEAPVLEKHSKEQQKSLVEPEKSEEQAVPETAASSACKYANAPAAAAFLVPGRPGYLGDAIRWGADQYAAWGELTRSVRENAPAVAPTLHLGDDPAQTRRFVLGMHNRALGIARGVMHFLPFDGVTHLLDVGGGPGTYAMLLAQKYPMLQVTVLDLPGVVTVAQELIAHADLSHRVTTLAGSALDTDYGMESRDGILFSGVLHQMTPATIVHLFAKAYRALRPGGIIVISDVMLDASKTQPVFATLFSLQMLLTSEAGAVFSDEEGLTWLERAGFMERRSQTLPPPLPYKILTARKPK